MGMGGWVGSMQVTLDSYNMAGSLGSRPYLIKDIGGPSDGTSWP